MVKCQVYNKNVSKKQKARKQHILAVAIGYTIDTGISHEIPLQVIV